MNVEFIIEFHTQFDRDRFLQDYQVPEYLSEKIKQTLMQQKYDFWIVFSSAGEWLVEAVTYTEEMAKFLKKNAVKKQKSALSKKEVKD